MAGAEFGGAEAFFVRLAIALGRTDIEQRVVIRANPARAVVSSRLSCRSVVALTSPPGAR